MREKSELVVQCSNSICIDMVRGVPRAPGEDQVHLWIRGHHCAKPTPHEFQPFQPLASSWFLLFAFWTFLCVRKHARRGPRRFSHSFATAWHYLQRPGTRDIDVCPKNSSWGIRVPAAAGRFVITLYQVLQPYHIKALGVVLQYAIGPMGRLSRKRPGGGTAAPPGRDRQVSLTICKIIHMHRVNGRQPTTND